MYVRKKKNRSGTTSVVVVSKSSGRYKEIRAFGTSSSQDEVNALCDRAESCIRTCGGQQELDFEGRKRRELEETERLVNNIDNVLINGSQYEGFTMIPMIELQAAVRSWQRLRCRGGFQAYEPGQCHLAAAGRLQVRDRCKNQRREQNRQGLDTVA
ncbi:hypothetical protein [Bacteroides heparinolyticus]|uniref:hypothetical protein n=1 Tax=Prevotella heparinolytica TaxID=28113 RepID=UPI0035A0CCFF